MNAPQQPSDENADLVNEMMAVLEAQRTDYIAEGHVSAETRIDRMRRGMTAVHKHQDALVEALNTDFGCRPRELSLMTDASGTSATVCVSSSNGGMICQPATTEITMKTVIAT